MLTNFSRCCVENKLERPNKNVLQQFRREMMIVWTRIKAMEGDDQIDVLEGPHWGVVKHGVKIEHTGVRRALFCESKRNILMRV